MSLEDSDAGFPLRPPDEWTSQVMRQLAGSKITCLTRFQADEGGGLLRSAWVSAKAFAGRVLGRSRAAGYGRAAAFSADDMTLDEEEEDAERPMLGGRSNRRF